MSMVRSVKRFFVRNMMITLHLKMTALKTKLEEMMIVRVTLNKTTNNSLREVSSWQCSVRNLVEALRLQRMKLNNQRGSRTC